MLWEQGGEIDVNDPRTYLHVSSDPALCRWGFLPLLTFCWFKVHRYLKFPKCEILAGYYAGRANPACKEHHFIMVSLCYSILIHISYINGWKSWRKKENWSHTNRLAEVQCQWRNKFGIHEHFWNIERKSYPPEECQCVRNAGVSVRAWDCILQLHLEGEEAWGLAYEVVGQLKRN